MTAAVLRALAAAAFGAVSGAACVVLLHALDPRIALAMDADHAPLVRGFHPPERDPDGLTFAWTGERFDIRLPDLDRRSSWRFTMRLRGGRPDPATLPTLVLSADGIVQARVQTRNQWDVVTVTIPPAVRRGLVIQGDTETFVPSPQDPRQLGVMVDDVAFDAEGVVLPPSAPLGHAALIGALFGAAFAAMGMRAGWAAGAAMVLGLGQAAALIAGVGLYASDGRLLLPLAAGIALPAVGAVRLLEWIGGAPLRQTARFVAAFSAAALYLKLLVLLHPSMPVGDAMFHAHRFSDVLGGRYYFTSVAPGGYQFPYPIALYVFAIPFDPLVTGEVGRMILLRVITAVADTAAGLLLYPMVVRAWGDRLAGAIAVALSHLVPLDFQVLAVANLSNAFGQAVFVAGMAAATSLPGLRGAPVRILASASLLTIASLSHTSTFAILTVVVGLTAGLYVVTGGQVLRTAARDLAIAGTITVALAIVLYYAHFPEVYREQLARIGGETARATDAGGRGIGDRAALVPMYLSEYFGLPLLLLALAGLRVLAQRPARDRLGLAVAAWLAGCGLFLLIGVLTPIDMRYYLAAIPAVAICAGTAAARGWRVGGWWRLGTAGLLIWIVVRAVDGWLERI